MYLTTLRLTTRLSREFNGNDPMVGCLASLWSQTVPNKNPVYSPSNGDGNKNNNNNAARASKTMEDIADANAMRSESAARTREIIKHVQTTYPSKSAEDVLIGKCIEECIAK